MRLTINYWKRKGELVKGWDYRGEDFYFEENYQILQNLFLPNKDIRCFVKSVFESYKIQFNIIVGVHIRRGDYKYWLNGKYFYEINEYYKYMNNYSTNESDKKICFFISSNEKIDLNIFKGLNCFILPQSSPIADLYGLSCCDRIMGPLSTFSRWASFIGEVPLYVIEKDILEIKDNMFSKVISLYRCENGKEFTNWTKIEEENANRNTNTTSS